MAEESINLPVTLEITKQVGANIRRNSTGKSNSSDSGQKVLPIYLRASTGSCHDFCKYGRKHAFEAKAKRPLPKRTAAPKNDGQNPVHSVILAERKEMTMVKPKPSPDSKGHLPATSKIIKREVSSPFRKVDVSSKLASPNAKETNSSTKRAVSLKPKPQPMMPSYSSDTSEGLSGRRNSDIRVGKNTGNSKVAVKKALAPLKAVLSPKPSLNRVPSLNAKKHRNLKNQNIIRKTEPKQSNEDKDEEKALNAPLPVAMSPKPSLNRVASLNARKHRSLKLVSSLKNQNMIRKTELWQFNKDKDEDKKKTSHIVKNLKVVLPLTSQNRKAEPKKSNKEEDGENPVHAIKVETENKTLGFVQYGSPIIQLSSSPSLSPKSSSQLNSPSLSSHEEEDQEDCEYTDSEADDCISEDNETANLNTVETLEWEYKRRPGKAGMVLSEDKDSAPMKLKFRRGKVVELQSENNSPRRLKFRRGRVLGENPNVRGDARRSFRRREMGDGDTKGKPASEKVFLKHPDVRGKKDAQGLFNNVIEETASKLVEARKSKVKALVGAFETVISLQESKPSANVVT